MKALIGVLILIATTAPCAAQRRRGTELDLLRNESVLSEIGVSDATIEQIEELRLSNTTTTGAFEKFREEMRAAKTDEERTAIRQKIQDAVRNGADEYQQKALELLNDNQRKELRRVFIENYGIDALADDRVAADLKLSEEQQEKIKALLEERRSIESNGDLNDEDRTASLTESKDKILGSLSEQQLADWKQLSSAASAEQQMAEGSSEANNRPSSPTSEQPQGDTTASFGTGNSASERTVQRYSFNFRRAPWERVLQLFADGAGLTLDMQRVPPGSLTHLDQKEYSATRALDIINGYLIRKGFGVVRKDGFLVVVNLDEQLDQSLVPEVSLDELQQTGEDQSVGDNQLVTVRLHVEGLDTARTAQEIEALLGPWGSMIALTQSQIIMVTDIGANLRRILGLLENAARPDESTFVSYHLKNIDVEDAEPLLLTQFGMRQAATNVSSSAESGRYRDRRSRDDREAPPVAAASVESLQVASDVRTNSLLVTGTAAQHELVKTILVAIDVGESPDGKPLSRTGRRGKYLSVYDVSSSDAREVTKTLDAIMPGVVVNEDGRNGKIHIMATEREHEEVALLIRQLDGAGGRQSVAVIALVKMDPLMAASTLRSLFISEGTEAPTIETDLYGRRLIVRGEPEQVAQIKSVLAELGEDGSGVRPPSQDGLRRRYSLQGRSPDEFLRILQDAWQEAESNPIRIVVPARSGPVRERRTSDGTVNDSEAESPQQSLPQDAPVSDPSAQLNMPAGGYFTVGVQENSETLPPVVITVLGDDLLLTSEDPEALDRLEELLDSLQQTLPYRTRWTVFYLQSADATEAADLLAQIFPSSSVASTAASTGGSILGSLANSFSGIGSSLADATGLGSLGENPQSLRIIPDVRSNSLLIAGPDALLQDVWAMLRVLDSDDIPESLREMEQRTLTVEYADIRNVEGILREVFKPLMEVPSTGGRQQENPLAAMLGAGGSTAKQPQVRMTLGVDEQTSSLVISSSQAVFDDVKELVETLDKNAKDANRRIRVVQLKNADPVLIQRSLTGLFPRVTTSVTSSRTSGSGTQSAADQKKADDTRQQQENRFRDEAIRRFRERAAERGQSGGGGGATFGGQPSGNGGRGRRSGR
jgi:type II secretory pathway component GspD/PulD (secretin)